MSAENEKRGAWRVERHDHDDGSITYEIWQEGPVPEMIEFDDLTLDGYRRIGSFHELYDSKFAKKDAELICKAVNALAQHEAMRKSLDEAEALAIQYRSDLRHPDFDDGSRARRVQRIEKFLAALKSQTTGRSKT